MNRIFVFAFIGLLFIADSVRVDAHAQLVRSEPPAGATLEKSPAELRLWFTEPLKAALSTIEVFDASGNQVDKRDLHSDKTDPQLVSLSFPSLAAGNYKVVWHAVAGDLHTTKGEFSFRLARQSNE